MSLNIAIHQAQGYTVATPVYEGPLDLLLQLIERAELDITRLALAQVTDQYLAHLRELDERPAEEVSAFLVIAARLLQIKSEVLLPRPPVRQEGEEDPGEALARQLIIYKRFKEIAEYLRQREASSLRTYLRLAPAPRIDGTLDLTGLSIDALVEAAQSVFAQADQRHPLNTVVTAPKVTIREKISIIAGYLRRQGRTSFQTLLGRRPTNLDIVVTFLALLELIKRQIVQVQQDQLFGEIHIEPAGVWDEDQSFELEFGE